MPSPSNKVDAIAYPPIAMAAPEAARYLGISEPFFLALVKERRMPPARLLNRRRLWDSRELAAAFATLPHEDGPETGNVIDRLLSLGR